MNIATDFLSSFWFSGTIAGGLATLSLAVALGLALGAVRIGGFKLGIAGVLFSALLLGQLKAQVEPQVLDFLRDFALILFVYAIGLQVGPGFVDSLKAEGLRLNALMIAVLLLGGVMTFAIVKIARLNGASSPGLYSGAFTTTAGLAAGQEALKNLARQGQTAAVAGMAYAVTYPIGMVGPLAMVAVFRRLFDVNVREEVKAYQAAAQARRAVTTFLDIEVTNPRIAGLAIKDLALAREVKVIFSRLLHGKELTAPGAQSRLEVGDVVRAVGCAFDLEKIAAHLGRPSTVDLASYSDQIGRLDLVVTRTEVLGKTLRELNMINRLGVTLARVSRSGVDLSPSATLAIHFGDTVTAVGPGDGLAAAEKELGNCPDALNRPQLMPIFVGIMLGVIVGSVPLYLPGLKTDLRLGLAAGPMLVAIALSRLGNVGSVVWYMPAASNALLRDFGLAMFLACVGLQQGDHYIQKLLSGGGLELVAWGAAITILPLFIVGVAARKFYKMNFVTFSGWVAGAMTSSPALIFAGDLTGSDGPALAYAAVAPLGMIVPIICCQLLAALG